MHFRGTSKELQRTSLHSGLIGENNFKIVVGEKISYYPTLSAKVVPTNFLEYQNDQYFLLLIRKWGVNEGKCVKTSFNNAGSLY